MATFVDFSTPQEQALALAGHFDRLLKNKTPASTPPTTSGESTATPPATTTEGAAKPATEPETEFHAECRKLIEKKSFIELLDKLLSTNLFLEGQEKEIESTFNLFLSILLRDSSSHDSIFSKLVSHLASSASDRPLLRLKLLGSLYNVLPSTSPSRFDFFLSLLRLANDSGNSELLLPQFDKIEKHLSQFRETLDPEKLRQVYQLELDILRSSKTPSQSSAVAAHSMLVKYLTTFANPTETDALAKVESLAVEAAIGAIKYPEIVESIDELLRIPAIGQLKSTKPKLWELLSLFAKDSLNEFEKFVSENPMFLKDSGLNEDECLKKIRLLTLATLASESSEDQIPYGVIAGKLKIEESDVEGWVIKAISAGILGAKLDQLKKVAVITKATQRVFGRAQWEALEARLGGWKENVRQLEEMVGKNQSPKI